MKKKNPENACLYRHVVELGLIFMSQKSYLAYELHWQLWQSNLSYIILHPQRSKINAKVFKTGMQLTTESMLGDEIYL